MNPALPFPSSDLKTTAHWPSMARFWEQTGSPLRPSPEDAAEYQRMSLDWIAHRGLPRVLLLGVTPEIYRLSWPEGHDFVAVDQTAAMIENIWPGSPQQVVQANWLELPLPLNSRDLALCDGGLHLLDYPVGQQQLVDRLYNVLAPGGRCIFRLFVPPPKQELPDAVLADLMAGRVPNLNVLKLRLGMALQQSSEAGIKVHEVWYKLRSVAGDWEKLSNQLKWPIEHLRAIDAYFESKACYHFISQDKAAELFCKDGRFSLREVHVPSYFLGERCPIIAFDRQ